MSDLSYPAHFFHAIIRFTSYELFQYAVFFTLMFIPPSLRYEFFPHHFLL